MAMYGDRVAVVGGEINVRKIGETVYQHDSQSALLGTITVLHSNWSLLAGSYE